MSENIKNNAMEKSSFKFAGKNNILILVSAAIILIGLVMYFISGFNYGTEFTGGSMIHVDVKHTVTSEDYNKAVNAVKDNGKVTATVQVTGDEKDQLFIRFDAVDNTAMENIKKAFVEQFGITEQEIISSGSISKNVDVSAIETSALVVCVALFVITVYALVRAGLAGMLTFFVNELYAFLLAAAIFAVLQIEINASVFYIALLLLVMTSVFSLPLLIKMNKDTKGKKLDVCDAANNIVSASFTKYIFTAVALLIVINLMLLFGTPSFRAFALGCVVAVIVALFSGICVVGAVFPAMTKSIKIKRK